MKKIFILIVGAMIPITIVGLGIIIIKMTQPTNIWSFENQHIEFESYSPDKTYKIGVYNYDEGALGYTATQVSIIKSDEKRYPITGNVLQGQNIKNINWVSDKTAEIPILETNDWNSKVVVTKK